MMPHKIAKVYGPRILAFLTHLSDELRKRKIDTSEPVHLHDVAYDNHAWSMTVYPWNRAVEVDVDALVVELWLAKRPEDDLLWVNFVMNLETVGGKTVDKIEIGDLVKSSNVSGLEEQLREFEMGGTVIDIAKRIEAYVSSVRRKRPEGPREWSPHWDKPSLGAFGAPRPLHKIAKTYGPRILAFLNRLTEELRKRKIFVDVPQEAFDIPHDQFYWVMLVHPWEKTVDLRDDPLDIIFRLTQQPEEDLLWVNYVLDLITVGGEEIDSIEMGDLVKSSNVSGLEEQLRDFETSVIDIAKRVEAYVSTVRRKHPEGPREWSPRWKKNNPSMGAARKKNIFPVIRVNLVEHPGWKRWEPSEIHERIFDLEREHWRVLPKGDCMEYVKDILGDLYDTAAYEGPRAWSPRVLDRVGPIGVSRVCENLFDLKITRSLIKDAIHYMYEDAFMPLDAGVTVAMFEAINGLPEKYNLDAVWEPLLQDPPEWMADKLPEELRSAWREDEVFENVLDYPTRDTVQFFREPGHYDRYYEFDFGNTVAVEQLLKRTLKEDRPAVIDKLNFEFMALSQALIKSFFVSLRRNMENIYGNNRMDWRRHWRAMLKDKKRVHAAQQEILEFLKEAKV